MVHAVGHDQLFCEGQTPWLHGMGLAKVVWFDGGIGMPGDAISIGARNSILLALVGDFAVDGEGGCGGRRGVFLDNGGAGHEERYRRAVGGNVVEEVRSDTKKRRFTVQIMLACAESGCGGEMDVAGRRRAEEKRRCSWSSSSRQKKPTITCAGWPRIRISAARDISSAHGLRGI